MLLLRLNRLSLRVSTVAQLQLYYVQFWCLTAHAAEIQRIKQEAVISHRETARRIPQYPAELSSLLWRSTLRQDYVVGYHEHVWLTVHFLLRDLYCMNSLPVEFRCRSTYNSLIVVVLKHFCFLSDIVFYSQYSSLAYFIVRRPWTSDGGAIANNWLIDFTIFCRLLG